MKQKILVLDVGLGNVGSICNMFKYIGFDAFRSSSVRDLEHARKVILPGVGAFDAGVKKLQDAGLVEPLKEVANRGDVHLLGICLGMQLLFDSSEEGKSPGLGLIPGSIKRFVSDGSNMKIPHMGWNSVSIERPSRLFSGVSGELRYYFVHSYHALCTNNENAVGMTTHGLKFASIVEKGNVMGVQFHPEKSHRFGMSLLKNFAEL